MTDNTAPHPIDRLLAIMARLRDPERGCPWDRKQNYASLVPHTLEEAYEVADAIERNAMADLQEELGDLLFQVVFYTQLAREAGHFDFAGVASAAGDKLIRRHPHVFSATTAGADAAALRAAWERQKTAERAAKGGSGGWLGGIAHALPALTRAEKLQRRAARVGFDWEHPGEVIEKVREELAEVAGALEGKADPLQIAHEIGDLLFSCVNLARHLRVDAEQALRQANHRFERRFGHVETALAREGKNLESASLPEMDRLWDEAKRLERELAGEADGAPAAGPGEVGRG
jgi:nucleoside triphosphate diphosphatase